MAHFTVEIGPLTKYIKICVVNKDTLKHFWFWKDFEHYTSNEPTVKKYKTTNFNKQCSEHIITSSTVYPILKIDSISKYTNHIKSTSNFQQWYTHCLAIEWKFSK